MDADPDSRARTHLANERTFLAWFRTGITLVALGIAAAELLAREGEPGALVVRGLAALVVLAGAGAVAVGLVRYRHARRQIDAEGLHPAWTSITLAAAAGIGLAAVALVVVVVLRPV